VNVPQQNVPKQNVPQQEVGFDPPRGVPFDQHPIFVPTPNLKRLLIVGFASR
jgi:hypothetical protein